MSGVLETDEDNQDAVPGGWLADGNMRDYTAAAAGRGVRSNIITIEAALADTLGE